MNKYIIAIGIILFSSCSVVTQGNIIKKVQDLDGNGEALYTSNNGAEFYAPIGLYNIGDTVRFTNSSPCEEKVVYISNPCPESNGWIEHYNGESGKWYYADSVITTYH